MLMYLLSNNGIYAIIQIHLGIHRGRGFIIFDRASKPTPRLRLTVRLISFLFFLICFCDIISQW